MPVNRSIYLFLLVVQVYEAHPLTRFQGHPNIVSLYSYWSEKPNNPYTYKTLVLLFEEGPLPFCHVHSLVASDPLFR